MYTGSAYYAQPIGDGPKTGQTSSCCLIFFAVVGFALSLSLCVNVSWFFNSGFSYWGYGCCSNCGIGCCYACPYYAGTWVRTNVISQDQLPFHNNTDIKPGNGQPDYWGIVVLVACGAPASLLIACFSSPPSIRRGGSANGISAGLAIGFLALTAGIISFSVQMFAVKEQVVYNAFISQQYQTINESLMHFLSTNRFYSWYGTLLWWTFIWQILLASLALVYILAALCGADDFTGTRSSLSEGESSFY